MKMMAQIRADNIHTFTRKNGDKVRERLLTCIDLTPDVMVADSFEFLATNMSTEATGGLIGKSVELHVTSFVSRPSGVRLVGTVLTKA